MNRPCSSGSVIFASENAAYSVSRLEALLVRQIDRLNANDSGTALVCARMPETLAAELDETGFFDRPENASANARIRMLYAEINRTLEQRQLFNQKSTLSAEQYGLAGFDIAGDETPKTVEFLTEKSFYEKVSKRANIHYWKNRWDYLKHVVEWLRELRPLTVLELGANGINLTSVSDNMDLKAGLIDEDNVNRRMYIQDATQTPYAIQDKYYDVFVALQVFEHLGDKQPTVFEEIRRISKAAILSFPYKWIRPGNKHHAIDEAVISRWTNNEKPFRVQTIAGPKSTNTDRIIYMFKFEPAVVANDAV
jgi:hypothetical protein